MLTEKVQHRGVSHGLTECGYDITLKQDVMFCYRTVNTRNGVQNLLVAEVDGKIVGDRFCLGSSIEEFQMPTNLMGRVLNKSTWARRGLDASMTTNIEPGWFGHLTIELLYHGSSELHIPAGSGIAQVIFERIENEAFYIGKYQNQADQPVPATFA